MDARILRVVVLSGVCWSMGASARTKHFIVTAPSKQLAQQVADAAEHYRHQLAVDWTGKALPQWADICPIRVVTNGPASGETSFEFPVGGGHPRNWRMTVVGPPERILDSVLPHEILHTVFATHFQNPLPRWADEGACTTVEGSSERNKHDYMLLKFLKGDDGIPFNEMFRMREYPRKILPLYSQGYSVASFLIAQGGRRKFVEYVGQGMRTNNWTASTRQFYKYDSLSELQVKWVKWVGQGSPSLERSEAATQFVGTSGQSDPMPQVAAVASAAPLGGSPTRELDSTNALAAPVGAPTANGAARLAPPRGLRTLGLQATPSRMLDDSGWYARTARDSRQQSVQYVPAGVVQPGVSSPPKGPVHSRSSHAADRSMRWSGSPLPAERMLR